MWWLYRRALDRGAARQSTGWTPPAPAAPAPAPAPAPANGAGSYPWTA
jgi:hypothetical protein